ncbi:hypothetical protein D3C84_848240 [compost metagenome]
MVHHQQRQGQAAIVRCEALRLPGHEDRRGDVVERAASLAHLLVAALGGHFGHGRCCAVQQAAQERRERCGQLGLGEQLLQVALQGSQGILAGDGAGDVQRDYVAGAFPDRAEVGVAHQARIAPLLDVPHAAAHLHGVASDPACVAAGAELDQRREDAHALLRLGIAAIGTGQ